LPGSFNDGSSCSASFATLVSKTAFKASAGILLAFLHSPSFAIGFAGGNRCEANGSTTTTEANQIIAIRTVGIMEAILVQGDVES